MNGDNLIGSGRPTFATDPSRMGVCAGSPMEGSIYRNNRKPLVVRKRAAPQGYNYTIMG